MGEANAELAEAVSEMKPDWGVEFAYNKYAGTEQDATALSVPAQAIQNLGMRTSTVVRAVLPSGIDVVGSLAYNQREVATLQARSAGFVERVYGRAPGDVLPAGTPLAAVVCCIWSLERGRRTA